LSQLLDTNHCLRAKPEKGKGNLERVELEEKYRGCPIAKSRNQGTLSGKKTPDQVRGGETYGNTETGRWAKETTRSSFLYSSKETEKPHLPRRGKKKTHNDQKRRVTEERKEYRKRRKSKSKLSRIS